MVWFQVRKRNKRERMGLSMFGMVRLCSAITQFIAAFITVTFLSNEFGFIRFSKSSWRELAFALIISAEAAFASLCSPKLFLRSLHSFSV